MANTKTPMPPWAKGIIAVAIVGVAGYVAIQVVKAIKSAKKTDDTKKAEETVSEVNKELKEIEKQGGKLSFPESNYSSACNTIVQLLNGAETFGTELQVIQEVMKVVKTKQDWLNLVYKFGVRKVQDILWGETSYDLPTLLKDQLDTAGLYAIDFQGYKKSGWATNTRDILEDYLKKVGVVL